MISGMSSELFFNYIAMRYKGTEENKSKSNFNFILTDRNEKVSLIVSNGVVNPRIGSHLVKDVTATITMSRLDLAILTSGKGVKADELIKSGKIKLVGDAEAFKSFLNNIDNFNYWFNIIEP
jgi:alkyl sulfatase BDS1-like metallo-beta-lactamase superfamily hydrolase